MSLSSSLKKLNTKNPIAWKGPIEEGISQSLIQNYICFKERFRLRTIMGLKREDTFNPPMEFGNMWHICEEFFPDDFEKPLARYATKLCKRFPTKQADINKWFRICKIHFPLYVEYYKSEDKNRKYIFREQKVKVKFELPSGRVVTLRGMIDGGFIQDKAIWVQENKARGEMDEEKTIKQLSMDLQTLTYRVMFEEAREQKIIKMSPAMRKLPIAGVMYNVIRRPLSGGKGTIRQKKGSKNVKPETLEEYFVRLENALRENQDSYFARWDVPVHKAELEQFKNHVLIPVLENICDDYEWWQHCYNKDVSPYDTKNRLKNFPQHVPRHFIMPFGVHNSLVDSRNKGSAYDDYILTGSTAELKYDPQMFPELEEEE